MVRRHAALLHRCRGECREADDIADGVDVRHGGAEDIVDGDPAPLVGPSPAAASPRSSVFPRRPAEYMTVSAGIRFPLASDATAPSGPAWTAVTLSPKRNVTARSPRWYFSASTTSRSQNSSIRSRCSTTVTLVPRAANIDAYSIPITPAPATTMDRGTRARWIIPSESMTVRSSKAMLPGRAAGFRWRSRSSPR